MAVAEPRVGAVRAHAQKLRIHEGVKDALTDGFIHAEKALDLHDGLAAIPAFRGARRGPVQSCGA